MKDIMVKWSDKYNIGVPEIDRQHKRLFKMVNELYDGLHKAGPYREDAFRHTIKELVNYVHEHFNSEYNLMKEINYPHFDEQVSLHNSFIQKVLEYVRRCEAGESGIPYEFVNYLRDWVFSHISIEDKKIGFFLAKKS